MIAVTIAIHQLTLQEDKERASIKITILCNLYRSVHKCAQGRFPHELNFIYTMFIRCLVHFGCVNCDPVVFRRLLWTATPRSPSGKKHNCW